jgi:hypothetical protein
MAFAAPLLACCVVVLFTKVSFWGGNLSGNEAAAIAIATIESFIVTGSFIQIIGRQGHFYKETRQLSLCYRCCWSFFGAGLATLLACVLLGFLVNSYFRCLPLTLFGWCAAFSLGIGTYLLAGGVLYVLDGEIFVALGTLAGTAIVVVLHLKLGQPLLASQMAGILAAAGTCVLLALFRFRQLGVSWALSAKLPSSSQLVYTLWPYFIYGCLYYGFLFVDRVIAWSAHTESASLPLQFRGGYETALDVSLIAFVLQVGWIRASIARFYRLVTAEQKGCLLGSSAQLKKAILSFYKRQVLVFAALFALSSAAVLLAIHEIPALQAILIFRVAVLVLAGTPLLIIGLWHTALLFALSRPQLVLAALGSALGFDICSGYLLSRLYSYDLAIIGFDIGACALACISGWFCWRLLANFEYHYFAANI